MTVTISSASRPGFRSSIVSPNWSYQISTDRRFPETESYDSADISDPNGEGPGAANVFRGGASMRFIQLLADCPELCPKLEEIELFDCYTNGRSLVEFVRRRKAMKGYASIRRIGHVGGRFALEKGNRSDPGGGPGCGPVGVSLAV